MVKLNNTTRGNRKTRGIWDSRRAESVGRSTATDCDDMAILKYLGVEQKEKGAW